MKLTPKTDFKVFIGIAIALVLPATLTLLTIKVPAKIETQNIYTPYGYTWSLLLFITPIVAIFTWLLIKQKEEFLRKSFWLTLWILAPIGFVLDIFLGNLFFNFQNHEATLGTCMPGEAILGFCWPGYVFGKGWALNLPVEEFIFYGTGFMAILLIYIWCDQYWFGAYNVEYRKLAPGIKRLVFFHPSSALLGIFLIALAIIYKKSLPSPNNQGFPGYFSFLVMVSIVPSFAFFKTAIYFINWRAFSFTFFFLLLISLLWEATLGVPYDWWNYNKDQMLGIFIKAWSDLPVEAVLLWMSVTFTTVIVYEVLKIWMHSRKKAKEAFFGEGDSSLPHSCKTKVSDLKKVFKRKKS